MCIEKVIEFSIFIGFLCETKITKETFLKLQRYPYCSITVYLFYFICSGSIFKTLIFLKTEMYMKMGRYIIGYKCERQRGYTMCFLHFLKY